MVTGANPKHSAAGSRPLPWCNVCKSDVIFVNPVSAAAAINAGRCADFTSPTG